MREIGENLLGVTTLGSHLEEMTEGNHLGDTKEESPMVRVRKEGSHLREEDRIEETPMVVYLMTEEGLLEVMMTEEDLLEGDTMTEMTKVQETGIPLVVIKVAIEMTHSPETEETPPETREPTPDMRGAMTMCSTLDMVVTRRRGQVPGPRWSR